MTVESDWWQEIDDAILRCLVENPAMTSGEMARELGMSTDAVTSLLGRLAQEGKIVIVRVALAAAGVAAVSRPVEVGHSWNG